MFQSNPSKKLISIFLLMLGFTLLTTETSHAQVQIINGSFENYQGLPSSSGMWNMMDGWSNSGSFTANPDFYHMDGVDGGNLPETPLAFVDAYEGRAIAGLEVSRRSGTNKREYLTGQFTEPLEPGKKYEFSFAIANGDVYEHSAAGLGVSHLGVAFTAHPLIQYEREPLNHHPNFYLNHVHYYQGWKIIKFVFTPNEPCEYFTFGMFGYDNGKMIESFEEPERLKAYYFVDDFSIRMISSTLQSDREVDKGDENVTFISTPSTYVSTAFTPNGDLLNDEFTPSLEPHEDAALHIYNRGGALVWKSVGQNVSWDGMDVSGAMAGEGVYVWVLTIELEDGSTKEISGPVTLLH
ncbi:MAG: hypothetical protein CMB32_05495 [Euryarchaeota archaeon]|nr:hypothetical protein [Euryarchaeota archaeon]